jgi:integrase
MCTYRGSWPPAQSAQAAADRAAAVLPLRPTQKIILADPARDLTATAPRGFTGQTITLDQQRALYRRWTTSPGAHPHEALLGILALLDGASSSEVRHLQASDFDADSQTIRLAKRPHPVPLDPASWQVLQRCLAHRENQRTANPHVIVTKGTKARAGAAGIRAAACTMAAAHAQGEPLCRRTAYRSSWSRRS